MKRFRNIFKGIMVGSFAFVCGIGLTDSADAAEATSVWVGETELTEGEYLPVNSTEVTKEKPEEGYAYFSSGELYLYNYTYTGTDRVFYTDEEGNEHTSSIWTADDLVINYEGDNYIAATNDGYSCITASYPQSDHKGMVTINAANESAYLKVEATERGHAIHAERGHVYINGPGKIDVYAYNGYAVNSKFDINIVNIDGYFNASSDGNSGMDIISIVAQGDVWIEGTATIESSDGRGIYAACTVYILASTEGTDRADIYFNTYSDCIFSAGSVYLSGKADLYTENGYCVQCVGSIEIIDEDENGVADTDIYCKSNDYGFVSLGAVLIKADLEMDTKMSAIYNGANVTIQPADKNGKDTVVTIRGGEETICSQGIISIKNNVVTDEDGNKTIYKPQVRVETTGLNAVYADIDSIVLQGDFYTNGSVTAVNTITVGMEEAEWIPEEFTENIIIQAVDNGLWAANKALTINKYVALDVDSPAMGLSGTGIVIDSDKTVDVNVEKDDAVGCENGDIIFSGDGDINITARDCSAVIIWSGEGHKFNICGSGDVTLSGGTGLYGENYDAVNMIGNTEFVKSGSGNLTIASNSGHGIGMIFSDSTCKANIGGTGSVCIESKSAGIYQENPGTITIDESVLLDISSQTNAFEILEGDIIIADDAVVNVYAEQSAIIAENVYIDGGQVDILTQWGHCMLVSGVVEILTEHSVKIDSMDAAYAMIIGNNNSTTTQSVVKAYILGENEAYEMNGIYVLSGDVLIGGTNNVTIETGYGNGVMLANGDLELSNTGSVEIIGVRGVSLLNGTMYINNFGELAVRAIYTGRYAVMGEIDLSGCAKNCQLMAARTTYPGTLESWDESMNDKYYCVTVEEIATEETVLDNETSGADVITAKSNSIEESLMADEAGDMIESQTFSNMAIRTENNELVVEDIVEEVESSEVEEISSEEMTADEVSSSPVVKNTVDAVAYSANVNNNTDVPTPETGDSFELLVMVAVMLGAFGCACVSVAKAKK